MVEIIKKLVEAGIKDNRSTSEIREDLVSKGYLESDVDETLSQISSQLSGKKDESFKSLLTKKIFLDRIGYGFGATQFINILFSMTGASFFFIGFINAIKSALSTLFSGFLNEYSSKTTIPRVFIKLSGLLFGFSFMFLAFAVSIRSYPLFAISLLLGSMGIVSYGDTFKNMMSKQVGKLKFTLAISRLAFVGMLITTVSLLLSGFLMDFIPIEGKTFIITLGKLAFPYKVSGYLIAFMVTAIASILSSHFLVKIKISETEEKVNLKDFFSVYIEEISEKVTRIFKNKYLFIMTLATLIIAIFQSVLNSFIGIYMYDLFLDTWFKGFMNIAVIYGFALIVSFFGPMFASKLNKYLGLAPMFVFGALIMALLPLTVVFNPTSYYPAFLVASALSVLGVAIIGSGQSILASRILNERDRHVYYTSAGILTIIPFLIFVGILVAYANSYGLISLFKLIGIGVVILLVPLYLYLVWWSTKQRV